MSFLSPVRYLTAGGDSARSRITDLALVPVGDATMLVSTTRYDGALQSWSIDGPQLTTGAFWQLQGGDVAGGTASLVALQTQAAPLLLVGGGANGTFQQLGLVTGGFQQVAALPAFAGFQHGLALQAADGSQMVYGAIAGQAGLASLQFAPDGQFVARRATTATEGPVADLAAVEGFVASLQTGSDSLSLWRPGSGGTLTEVQRLTPETGLWIAAPTALRSLQIDGSSYLVVAAAGSSSLTVLEVAPDGGLTIRDHLLDTLDTRFGGVSALETVTLHGRSYVIAGGADDGISVFTLLAGGQLVALAHLEDTAALGLENVSAIAARGRGDGIDIFVASSSEAGITQLRLETGPAGLIATAQPGGPPLQGGSGADLLTGTAGNDRIDGAAGADILRDGAGADTLTGGPGADLFILTADGQPDMITDFTPGEDRLDLSLWPLLRDISQLTMTITATGFEIRYGSEVLSVNSADGGPIDYRLLGNDDLLNGLRLPVTLVPGFAGPATPPPPLPPAFPLRGAEKGFDAPLESATKALGQVNLADLRGAMTGQAPQRPPGEQAAIGGTGADQLRTAAANDLLLGRDGNDRLTGESGDDVLLGGGGDDMLYGGNGNDLLLGGAGDDQLFGGNGDDVLLGDTGNDLFFAGRGDDLLLGSDGNDTLNGEDGRDTLDGGAGNDLMFGGTGDDDLRGASGDDLLQGDDGRDTLAGGAGNDTLVGGAGADLFKFDAGSDLIGDFEQGIDRILLDPRLWTGLTSAADLLFVYGRLEGTRAIIDFEDGDQLMIDGVTDYARLAEDITLF